MLLTTRILCFEGQSTSGGGDCMKVNMMSRWNKQSFKELSVTATVEGGVTASIIMSKSGNKAVR